MSLADFKIRALRHVGDASPNGDDLGQCPAVSMRDGDAILA
jgi:hypothetical protein